MKYLLIILFSFLIYACNTPDEHNCYKHVTNVVSKADTVEVTYYEYDHSKRNGTIGGAISGYLLGGKLRHAVIGGIIGHVVSRNNIVSSRTQKEIHTTYTVYFSNGEVITSHNIFSVGDSVETSCK